MAFFGLFGFSSVLFVHMEGASFASILLFCVQGLGHIGVPPAGHPLWAEVGGGITFVTSGGNAWKLKELSAIILGLMLSS